MQEAISIGKVPPKVIVLEGKTLTLKEIKLVCGKGKKAARIFINGIPEEYVLHVLNEEARYDSKHLLNRRFTKKFLKSIDKIEFSISLSGKRT